MGMKFLLVYGYTSFFGRKVNWELFEAENEEWAKAMAHKRAEEPKKETWVRYVQIARIIEETVFDAS
jgi:hypothetical protein